MKLTIRAKLFLSHFFAIMFVSGSIGSYFYGSAIENLENSLKSRLRNSAALLSKSFNTNELDLIQSELDKSLPEYEKNLQLIVSYASSNDDIAFIYIMRLREGHVEFVLDSDQVNPAKPGEVYKQNIPELLDGFTRVSVDSSITTDRWGSFMSGYAPIGDGSEKYLIGLDMKADDVSNKLQDLKAKGLLSLLMSLILAYACCYYLSRNFVYRIRRLHDQCGDLIHVDSEKVSVKGDEIDDLSDVFSVMLDSFQKNQEILEAKVTERTEEVNKANRNLMVEVKARKQMMEQLRDLARTDYLTTLINRREMTNILRSVCIDYKVTPKPFVVTLMDIDDFKNINDCYGNGVGDEVLLSLCKRLSAMLDANETLARWGGEELLFLMTDAALTDAALRAEALRKTIEGMEFSVDNNIVSITASFGLAEYEVGRGLDATIKEAGLALYRAKRLGKNRVSIEDS